MREWRNRYTARMGKKLKGIHAWNAWVVLFLAVSGIVLYLPALRGVTAAVRVILKQGHIWAGVISVVLLLLYLPFLKKHAKQLRGKTAQASNLTVVLFLLVGWSVTGTILWLERSVPPMWTSTALLAHDFLTWVGVPYALFHSVTRSRWVRDRRMGAWMSEVESEPEVPLHIRYDSSRRSFVTAGIVALLAAVFGPVAYRWVKKVERGGSVAVQDVTSSVSADIPNGQELLTPLPDSNPPIGGGADGSFRIYTVTPIPVFDQNTWRFTINGLVDRTLTYDWESFTKLTRKAQVSNFHCVTGWSVYHVTWEGISLKELLAFAGVKSEAKYVKFYSGDGVYTDALSLDQANMDDVMIAALIDGKPIPEDLGGPVRLIVPRMYAYKSVKWLESIELIAEDHIGYWQLRGYEVDAWVPGAKV